MGRVPTGGRLGTAGHDTALRASVYGVPAIAGDIGGQPRVKTRVLRDFEPQDSTLHASHQP
jgi:hypothetical protein